MVAISLYRGNLHRVPDRPRQWPMPPHRISLRDFKRLTLKRSQALLRSSVSNPSSAPPKHDPQPPQQQQQHQIENGRDSQSQPPNGVVPNLVSNYDNAPQQQLLPKPPGATEGAAAGGSSPSKSALLDDGNGQEDCGGSGSKKDSQDKEAAGDDSGRTQIEVTNGMDVPGDKERRKKDLERKLQILNDRKHQLVQALKQIFSAEEEMMRRNSIQIAGGRAGVPLQAEAHAIPKMSAEANLGDDLEGESEDASNQNTHGRHFQQIQCISPSTASPLRRPAYGSLQHNMAPFAGRGSLVAAGHTQTTSNMLTGVAASPSPSRFAPSGHQGHAANLPPISVSGSHFIASSPSPAGSGGTSISKDGRLTSPTWN